MIGDYLKTRKQKKLDKKYQKEIKKFSFSVNPLEVIDRYIVLEGQLYRLQFSTEGISITDGNGDFIDCQLTRLQVMKTCQIKPTK